MFGRARLWAEKFSECMFAREKEEAQELSAGGEEVQLG
jgi:hypothetical protein